MISLLRRISVIDLPLIVPCVGLILTGLIALYSITAGDNTPIWNSSFGKQVIWAISGIIAFIMIQSLPASMIQRCGPAIYGMSILLLIVVLLLPATKVHRWISLGFFQLQPSELAKLGTLLVCAEVLSRSDGRNPILTNFRLMFIILIPAALIAVEPDFSSATVLLFLALSLLFWRGFSLKIVLLGLIPCIAVAAGFHRWGIPVFILFLIIGWIVAKPRWWKALIFLTVNIISMFAGPHIWSALPLYQQQRLLIFLGLRSDPHGAAYQVIQSKLAIGSGGFLGKGLFQGSQTQLRFLPEQHTDFIFSVIGEELGFLGSLFVLTLFFLLFIRMLRLVARQRDSFSSYFILGALCMFAYQFAVNVGMTMGIFPVTGLPLPFLSYGGSSLIINLIIIGLVMRFSRRS